SGVGCAQVLVTPRVERALRFPGHVVLAREGGQLVFAVGSARRLVILDRWVCRLRLETAVLTGNKAAHEDHGMRVVHRDAPVHGVAALQRALHVWKDQGMPPS